VDGVLSSMIELQVAFTKVVTVKLFRKERKVQNEIGTVRAIDGCSMNQSVGSDTVL
jgi:hypothetical protein